MKVFFFNLILFFNFTILYCFCHISTWIHHRYTRVPHPGPSSLLPPRTIPLDRPSAPAPGIQYHASNLDWWFVSYMILYMFQCHSPKSSHPLPLPHSPKDCSIHQCLFCCLIYKVIVQFSSVTQSCPTLHDPMNHSMPGLPVHHQLLEFTQTHVHWVSNAIQPSHPLLFPSPPALNLSQHQGLFQLVSSSHQVVKVLEFQLQHQSFQ